MLQETSGVSFMQANENGAIVDEDEESESSTDSDSDSEDDKNTKKPPPTASSSSAPMTASRHAELLAQLTSFVKGPAAAGEDLDIDIDAVGYITEDSEDEDDVEDEDADELRQDEDGFMMMGEEGAVDIVMDGQAVDMDALRELMNAKKVEEEKRATMMATTTTRTSQSPKQKQTDAASSSSSDSDSSDSDSSDSDSEEESSTLPARLAQVDMSDYEEENETAPSGPLKTEHEILEEPVQLPPFYRLGEGARVILAGEVVSFMRDSGLGVWEEWQRAQKVKEEAEAEAEAEKVIGDEEKKVQEVIGDESGQISESVEPVVEAGQVDVDVEVEVATSETLRVDATAATLVKDDPVDGTTTTVVQPEPSAEQTPIIAMDAQAPATTASQTPQTTTSQTAATKRPRNRAGKRRPNDASKGKQTSTTNKPAGPPAPKSSGTVVVQALRPPVGTVKGGTDRLDEDGWLLDGSVICTGEGEAVAVVSRRFFGYIRTWPGNKRGLWRLTHDDILVCFRSQKCLVQQRSRFTCLNYHHHHSLFHPLTNWQEGPSYTTRQTGTTHMFPYGC
ncbi:hypothetical protein QFC24_001118 [Naganishia onofrii]|uniref:Uncharacterized protein n=1 Tax=Naganishia onofrii TaxID=1851511 RepID=A0ACC2XV06_9TREE|nr:hypothetical protein QFC24_001118 [Naganishia onofrii]